MSSRHMSAEQEPVPLPKYALRNVTVPIHHWNINGYAM